MCAVLTTYTRTNLAKCNICGWKGSAQNTANRKRHIRLGHIENNHFPFIKECNKKVYDVLYQEFKVEIEKQKVIMSGNGGQLTNKQKQQIALIERNKDRLKKDSNAITIGDGSWMDGNDVEEFREMIAKTIVSCGLARNTVNDPYFRLMIEVCKLFEYLAVYSNILKYIR